VRYAQYGKCGCKIAVAELSLREVKLRDVGLQNEVEGC
jgi:hypothetical protein